LKVGENQMRIGYIQFEPRLGDLEGNRQRVAELVSRAAEADLVVLPELANSGYNFESPEQAAATAEDAHAGPFVSLLGALAVQHEMHIVAGLNEHDAKSGNRYNSSVLVGPGGVVGVYRKLHLFLNEKDFFTPGDAGLPVFDIGGCRVGMLICFDWTFPEAWRVLTLRGADVIAHPSNLVLRGRAQRAVPVHAMINRIYVVTANRIGSEGELTFTGCSLIADPAGGILSVALPDEETIDIVEVDVSGARHKQVTERNHLIDDRRPAEYGDLVK
jgi:beta-ureidopropionase